ncbi:MAG: ATP-binding cassette domain-containing protein [Bacteroidota bacterium]
MASGSTANGSSEISHSQLEPGKTYAITGPNGSGKSTLSQVLWGQVPPTAGTLKFYDGDSIVDDAFHHCINRSPYMDLIEEFTLDEVIRFHFKFKTPSINVDSMPMRWSLPLQKIKKSACSPVE